MGTNDPRKYPRQMRPPQPEDGDQGFFITDVNEFAGMKERLRK